MYLITTYRKHHHTGIGRGATWRPIATQTAPTADLAESLRADLQGSEGDLLVLILPPSKSTTVEHIR